MIAEMSCRSAGCGDQLDTNAARTPAPKAPAQHRRRGACNGRVCAPAQLLDSEGPGEGPGTTGKKRYDYKALERIALIKHYLSEGYPLREAAREAARPQRPARLQASPRPLHK